MTDDEIRASLAIDKKFYDVYDHLIHIRGFVDDVVVYRYWNRRKGYWEYRCEFLEFFGPEFQFYTKVKKRA